MQNNNIKSGHVKYCQRILSPTISRRWFFFIWYSPLSYCWEHPILFYLLYHNFVNISSGVVRICPKRCCIYSFVNIFWTRSFLKCFGKCVAVRICLQSRKARNASTKFRKTSESKKTGEISRNLRFSRFFVPASKSDTHHVSTGHFRCQICVIQFRCTRRIDFSRGKSGLAKPCV